MTRFNEWLQKQLLGSAKVLITLGLLNQLLYPPFAARRLSQWVHSSEPEKIDVSAFTYLSLEENPGWDAWEYLTFAHSLIWPHHNEEVHNCNYLSDATYDLYHELIALHQREDLEDKVRFASVPLERPQGHMWLEVYEGKKWLPFETRNQTPKLLPLEVADYAKNDKEYRVDINSRNKAEFVTLPGKVPLLEREVFYPSGVEAFLYPGGLLRVMLKEYCGDFENEE